jgi:signal transduction histidine kinase/ActR/RegA family two-component response regulator
MAARNPPIRRKLMTIILSISGIVLLLNFAVLFTYQYFTFRAAAVRNLETLGKVIAANSTAALAFDNIDDAKVILAGLKAESQVTAAGLYDTNGALFAKYPDDVPDDALPTSLGDDGYRFVNAHLRGYQPVVERGRRLGTLYLQSNMRTLYAAFRFYSVLVASMIVVSLLIAYAMSAQLQRQVSQPILTLAETASAISERRDYSVRAAKATGHELSLLTDAFNHMLTRIQAQLGNLDLLQRITRAIAERQDMSSIFRVVLRSLEESMPIDFGCICLYEPMAGTLTVSGIGSRSAQIANSIELKEQDQIPVDRDGLLRCIHGVLVYEPDIAQVQSVFPQRLARVGLRSLVCAPLLVESTIFGVLIIARREVKSFSSGDCEFLVQLGEHVALAAHQKQLHTALQQAYDDLRQSQHTVMQQERLRALGQMASGIAHDINNAISPVALYTEALLEREPNLSERARGYLATIRQAIEDVADTVARMREFYRNREPQLILTTVDLNHLATQVIDLTRARWSAQPQARGIVIDLRTNLAAQLPPIMGAEAEIRDALTNLIFNAVDAMPEGGTLTVASHVIRGGESSGGPMPDSVAIEVSDTGIGMDGEVRQRCLEPFFTTKGERGTGLGLAMVYGMVQRHSAELEIDSKPGHGTTMRLIFPVATPVFSSTIRMPAVQIPGRRLRILIVDDDPLLLKSLRDILESDGHIVTSADGGQSGIDAFRAAEARKEKFGLVITDLGMPYVDGFKVAANIKAASSSTPIVMLTGWGQRLLAEKELPPNIDRILAKPPRIHELRAVLAELPVEKASIS